MGHSVFKQCHGLTTCPSFTQCRCSFSRTLLLITFLATPRDFVDNVFFLDATKMLQTESFAIVSHPFFYCYPLEILEMENLLMMIGLVHTAHSAGSPTMALRNFHTHTHGHGVLTSRLTQPRPAAPSQGLLFSTTLEGKASLQVQMARLNSVAIAAYDLE